MQTDSFSFNEIIGERQLRHIFNEFKNFFEDCNWWQKILFILLIPVILIAMWIGGCVCGGQD